MNPDEGFFRRSNEDMTGGEPIIIGEELLDYEGLTKLEYMSVRIAQAMVTNAPMMSNIDSRTNRDADAARKLIASEAVKLAKAIINECNKEE